jgi:hypothetical protein
MRSLGAEVVYPVTLPQPNLLTVGDNYQPFIVNCKYIRCLPISSTARPATVAKYKYLSNLLTLLIVYEHQATADEFLRCYIQPGSRVYDLASLVRFNNEHAKQCMPKGESASVGVEEARQI